MDTDIDTQEDVKPDLSEIRNKNTSHESINSSPFADSDQIETAQRHDKITPRGKRKLSPDGRPIAEFSTTRGGHWGCGLCNGNCSSYQGLVTHSLKIHGSSTPQVRVRKYPPRKNRPRYLLYRVNYPNYCDDEAPPPPEEDGPPPTLQGDDDAAAPEVKKCPTCDEQFRSEFLYNRHREKHAHANWSCFQCSATFVAKAALTQHEGRMHPSLPPGEIFTCEICKVGHSSRDGLKTHQRQRHGVGANSLIVSSIKRDDGEGPRGDEIDSDDERFLDEVEKEGEAKVKVEIEVKREGEDEIDGDLDTTSWDFDVKVESNIDISRFYDE
ncbi:uncharacterized protein LOC110856591 [Folsomia candida]|uniref:Ras-responsive element-binding protein 1 n=1 Tax=Folsomia candida TaxID=158441 RepID=A0A226DLA9_FOLCA|nr:uncharacterized protein LOC110856591 [Folsomia candida]OXA45910.1 Ras-responsive element-binding protein 1 [Folsomia candida]